MMIDWRIHLINLKNCWSYWKIDDLLSLREVSNMFYIYIIIIFYEDINCLFYSLDQMTQYH